jgi:hypothetical protein
MNGEPESANGNRRRISDETPPAGLSAEASAQAGAQEVTRLLADWSQGDQAALQKLTPLVYEELRLSLIVTWKGRLPITRCKRSRA